VRLAHDRYQQFQGGIKRHAIKMHSRIGVDRATRQDPGFRRRTMCWMAAALQTIHPLSPPLPPPPPIGIYDVPKVDRHHPWRFIPRRTAGSMRDTER